MGLKNERSLSRITPLLSGITRHGERGAAGKRWANILYNRPVSSGVDYFINNLKENNSSVIDKNAVGFLKQKAKMGLESNEQALLPRNDFEPIR